MEPNITKYMAFVMAADCGSFTKAAEMLNYTQSAVSRMISDLENEWKISLLERNKSGVKLTSDGLTLLPFAKEMCGKYKIAVRELDIPAYRNIGLAIRDKKTMPLAAKKFIEYL